MESRPEVFTYFRSEQTAIEFKAAPEIIGGIELNANGYKLSWSISAYLDSLQNSLSNTLKDTAATAPEAKKTTDKKAAPEKETATEKK